MFTAIIIKSIIIWKHEEGRGHGHLPPLLVLKLSPDALLVNCCLSHLAVDRIKWLNVVKDTLGNVSVQFSSVQSFSRVQLFVTPWTTAHQDSLSFPDSWSLLKLFSIESVMPSNHLILCCPLLLLPSIFPSIRVFSSESALLIRWSKYWNFSFNISPSSEYSGLTSLRMDWLDLLAVQGTLKSLLQHHSSKASILWHSVFFIVQLSHPYMTTGKTIASIRRTLLAK